MEAGEKRAAGGDSSGRLISLFIGYDATGD